MGEPLLLLNKVTKVFQVGALFSKVRIYAVWDVTLEIGAEPVVFTLVGESGSGKTTLANILLGLVKPTEGHVSFLGKSIESYKRSEFIRLVQPVFQNPYETFNPLKKIEVYFWSVIRRLGIANGSGRAAEQIIDEALHSVALTWEEVRGKYPHEFSGGQLQRLSIARALMVNPLLLVADEPVSMLDASLRVFVLNLFRKLKEEKRLYIVYITHDLATAYYLSDHIAVMLRGSIVETGPAEKVLLSPLHPYTMLLKESVPDPHKGKGEWLRSETREEHVLEIEEYTEQGCKFALRCPCVRDVCRKLMPPSTVVDGVTVKCWLYQAQGRGV
ncbi:MAG: ABC transporter ATP-binding protein [Candidatus Caldatribacterium sp.]|uniref:ABC transporter ATP-binding protein n=1 Tax=Candidatus Caldatribacterium sp. TaxID=2282143 RepID=UPI0029963454|nr:ABC transporter ATP-binding protein [Candidatus Caldatribacterium sp.]MCX7730626.1 ABC transporter ATP-binding protein [Candidatus Caldatribacterium sp.]MDW8081127.1 ABC transporter ATP-binding protein [Candidatus Calescibacterium sp.]